MFRKTQGFKKIFESQTISNTHTHTHTIYIYIYTLLRLCSSSFERTQQSRFFLFSNQPEDVGRFSVGNVVVSGLGWWTKTKIPVTNTAAHFHLTAVWGFGSAGMWRFVVELAVPDFATGPSTVILSGHKLLDKSYHWGPDFSWILLWIRQPPLLSGSFQFSIV
jgi:hypothetical protein